jgi:hypothetical protein
MDNVTQQKELPPKKTVKLQEDEVIDLLKTLEIVKRKLQALLK